MMKQRIFYLLAIMITVVSCMKTPNTSPLAIVSFSPRNLAAYNYITITGAHFDTAITKNSVSFNGQAAVVFSVKGDSSMTVIVPRNVTPGKITVTVNWVSTTTVSYTVLPGAWIRKADLPDIVLPNARAETIGFAIGNTGYIGLGTNNGETFGDLYAYEPATDKWTARRSLPIGLERAFSMVINGKAYVGTGYSRGTSVVPGGFSKQLFEYDPSTDKWVGKGDFPGLARKGASAFVVGEKGYAGFGEGDTRFKDWWQYDPASNIWTRKADFPGGYAPDDGSGFALDNKIYVGGTASLNPVYNEWWQYDPANDTWTKKQNMPWGFDYLKGVVINNKGYLMGTENWQYDDVTDSWTQKAFFGPRTWGAVFSIGNKGYYGTGAGLPGILFDNDFWEYTPE